MWCLSGIVMMYVRYPELQRSDALAALPSLQLSNCCVLPADLYGDNELIATAEVTMLAERPLLRVEPDFGPSALIDLRNGQRIDEVTAADALQVAQQYSNNMNLRSRPQVLELIDRDQWTVYASYDDARPLHHLALNDAAGIELYVSSVTGLLVLKTTRNERFWNWLGSVPHWLYFTSLRANTALWAQVVIWSSILGTFLTLFGMYLGIWQLRRKSDGLLHSPYRGWKYWHHVPGLLFGVLLLTWVISGLLSMNPWGLLETQGAANDARRLRGELPTWTVVRESLQQLPTAKLPLNTVSVKSSVLQGRLFYVLGARSGERQRFDTQWNAAPLTEVAMANVAAAIQQQSQWSLLTTEDTYYYSHGRDQVELPVLRVLADVQASRFYLDPLSGELLRKVDDNARWYRWLHSGLHRLDFAVLLRVRPFWDLLMWLSLLGAAVVCATGTWLGIRRLRGRSGG